MSNKVKRIIKVIKAHYQQSPKINHKKSKYLNFLINLVLANIRKKYLSHI
jgi:hypothetical protein